MLFLLILLTAIIFAGLLFAIISQQITAFNRTKPDALIHRECYFADISELMRNESLIRHFFQGTNPWALKKGSHYYLLLESNYINANSKLWKGQITGAHRKRSLRNVPKISLGQVIFNEIPLVGGHSKSAYSTLFLAQDVEVRGTIEQKSCRHGLLADAADVSVYGPYAVTYARLPEGVLFEIA